MTAKILFAWFMALANVGNAHAADFRADANRARAAYTKVLHADMPEIVYLPCGEENAAYSAVTDEVYVCIELYNEPDDAITFILAHEFAHALIQHLDLPHIDEEAAADELGALVLLEAGDRDAVVAGAALVMERFPGSPGDLHPPGMLRARMLLCLDDGLDGDGAADQGCVVYLRSATDAWNRLFEVSEDAQ